jgi:drug/metabolite transporter (DMT)-like permease
VAISQMTQKVLQPNLVTLIAFVGLVLIGGANFVAVSLSNQDLPPFFGGGLRFALAGLLLLGIAIVRKVPFPKGRALVGAVIYGVLGFAAFFVLAYWALQELPAGPAGVITASVPLLTMILARIHGLEKMHWRGLVGGALTTVGIWVLLTAPMGMSAPLGSVLAMLGAAACLAEAGIIAKMFPPCHPVATNCLGMAIATVVLLVISWISAEPWSIPTQQATWLVLGHLVLLGSVALSGLYLFVLTRWTVSRASYQFVLVPFVAVLLAAWLANEPINRALGFGGAIVLFGVYIGAVARTRVPASATLEHEILSQRCST